MKNRSPARIVELCIYVLIIIAAVIWLITGGRLYNPALPSPSPPAVTESADPETDKPPPIAVPRGDVFPRQ
jgi:hypothetical protein